MTESTFFNQFSISVQSKNVRTSSTILPTPPRVRTGSVFLPKPDVPRASISTNQETPLQFMDGVAIPNSVVRAQPRKNEQEEYEMRRRNTAAELERILRQFMPHEEDTEDSNLLSRIQRELERRRLVNRTVKDKDEEYDEQKEQRRISRRTSRLEPLACGRRSTCESIHRSIQQSEQVQKLITDDFLEHPVDDEEKKTEITTLSPPKQRSLKQSKASAKTKQAAKAPSQNTHRHPLPKPQPTQLETKRNRGSNSNQKQLNTQPWTSYVQPKVKKSNESLEDLSADYFSVNKGSKRKVGGSSVLAGGSLFIKPTALH